MESSVFFLTDVPHSAVREKGFPLDSISIDQKTGQYFYDLPDSAFEQIVALDGFPVFFQNVLKGRSLC